MKKIHLLNIGYPKAATTWIWDRLSKIPNISFPMEKENPRFWEGQSVEDYISCYNKWDITANFFTYNFCLERYRIKQLSSIDTAQVSFILRHPLDLAWSLYFFLNIDRSQITFDEHCIELLDQSWFFSADKIITRWKEKFDDRFRVFYYEDFAKDNHRFFSNYCKEMLDLKYDAVDLDKSMINSTNYSGQNKPQISPALTKRFNMQIEKIQTVVDKDLSHWRIMA